jgi:chorismate mutase/prephenate dehydratase
MSENQQNKTLALFREQIDEIDLKILNLLKDRMAVIKNVGDLKKSYNEKFYIRSNREADMIKNLVNLAENKFPKSTIINIWRKIITTANMSEQELRIAIHNPKNISDYTYLIREYYNNDVPIINYDSANSVVSDLENNNAQIGIFALPSSNDESDKKEDTKENWWISQYFPSYR